MGTPKIDPRVGGEQGYTGSSKGWQTLTPNDAADLAFWPIAIEVGSTGGTVVMQDADGNQSTFYFAAGQQKALRPVRILATGTTATPIIGLK